MMTDIRGLLARGPVVADGAAGTYLSALAGRRQPVCEMLNLTSPQLVGRMHSEYIAAGAKLILTNTFGANIFSLGADAASSGEVIRAGVRIALRAAADAAGAAAVAADIGPVPESAPEGADTDGEYRRMADIFLDEGIKTFVFETFAQAEAPVKAAKYIKSKAPDAFIMISFAVTPDGYSGLGGAAQELVSSVVRSGAADACGFNCCTGPAQLVTMASEVDFGGLIPSIMPNAGYPSPEDEALSYTGKPGYFAARLARAVQCGFRILGGCCGTTPEHIRCLARAVADELPGAPCAAAARAARQAEPAAAAGGSAFAGALVSGRKTVVVELDPPTDADPSRFDAAAQAAALAGADALTIADSPMAKPRADPVVMAARVRGITGMDVIPHICCRDRNINALRSSLIAAHISGVRSILAVTGDRVPDDDRGSVRSVFNINSAGLCSLVRGMNKSVFAREPMLCGCAYNVNAANPGEELRRLERKIAAGADFALTQPVFSPGAVEALRLARGRGIKLIAGILTPLSLKNALFLANEIPGVTLPDEFIARFSADMTRGQGEETGLGISLQAAQMAAEYADGFYIVTPFGRRGVTGRLLGLMKENGLI
jgi:methionine synthase I (cobalamin-dependent)/5,10-methylenetetrahydrofolate reductase